MNPAFDTGISAKLGARTIPAHLISPDSDTTLWDVDLAKLRLMPLLLYVAAFWFLWGWLRLVIGPAGALIAVTLYAFVEIIVVHQRLIEADNLVTPLVLASFYFLERWRRGWAKSQVTGVILIATVGLAGASKVVALSAVPAIFARGAIHV